MPPSAPEECRRAPEKSRRVGIFRRAAGWLYGLGARIHRGTMARTASARGRLACAVVSVGGLTLGGAGKTPVAARLARALAERGHRVVLASRGYRGRSRVRVLLVSDGTTVRTGVEQAGDEALILAAHAPGVPVLVGRDRRIVGHHAVSVFDAEIVVLDDGFQHHRLARDLDIVCVDGRAGFGNARVVPAGPLREPIGALAQADWLCIVGGDGPGPARDRPPRREPPTRAPEHGQRASLEVRYGESHEIIHAERRPIALVSLDQRQRRAPESLAGAQVGMLAGIARPGSLRASLESLGAEVVTERIFPDHHAYAASDCRGLARNVDLWVTTEKDGLKILPAWVEEVPLFVLKIEAEIVEEAAVLERLEDHLRKAGRIP